MFASTKSNAFFVVVERVSLEKKLSVSVTYIFVVRLPCAHNIRIDEKQNQQQQQQQQTTKERAQRRVFTMDNNNKRKCDECEDLDIVCWGHGSIGMDFVVLSVAC